MANLSLNCFGEKPSVRGYQMFPDLLWTGPLYKTEGTVLWPLVLVSDMPFEVLWSSIFFAATGTATPLQRKVRGTLWASS
jgi:hypothetical protein